MQIKKKTPRDSAVTMTEIVLPNDTNTLNNLMGGKLMHWLDIAAAISAQKHSGRIVVTASVDNISFSEPIALGDVITIKAQVTRAFNEVFLEVSAENIPAGKQKKTNRAFFTFVAVDQLGNPISVPELTPETPEEQEFYQGALHRRQLRLLLAKRMKPEEAPELISLFFPEKL